MDKRITAVVLAALAVTSIACGTTGAGASGRQDGGAGGSAYLDPGFVDSDGATGGLVDTSNGPTLQP